MGKKSKSLVTEAFPVWTDDTDIIWMIAEKRNLCCAFDDEPKGRSVVKVVGTPGKVCKFEKDLQGAGLLRAPGVFEQFAEGLKRVSKDMAQCLGNRGDMEILSIVAGKDEYYVRIGKKEDEGNHGEEDRVLVDQEGIDSGEDSGRPDGSGEGTAEIVVDIPENYPIDVGVLSGERAQNAVADIPVEVQEKGEWVTKAEYSARYNVSESTIESWIRRGILKIDRNAYPRTVFDGEKVPVQNKRGKSPLWTWVDRDILEDANSQVSEEPVVGVLERRTTV